MDDEAPAGVDPLIGQPVGSYVITRCLGRGGMGAVYQGDHPTIGSKVAIKFLHRRYAADRAIVERFFNEAKAVNIIGHDNIVKVSDFAVLDDGSPYFIMEFLEGSPLTKLVGEAQPFATMGPIFLQLCEALQAAHNQGIVHRDLKPDNIYLVTHNRRPNFVKLVDFGIAKLEKPGANSKTRTGMVMGTAQYMSPEQASGDVSAIGPRSDVYSLGVILYQMMTGTLPFEGDNFGAILIGHMLQPPRPPREYVPDLPEALETIILTCLAKKPDERFASMSELYDAIGALLDELGLPREVSAVSAARPVSRPPGPISTPGATLRPSSVPGGTAVMTNRKPASTPNGTVILGGQTRGATAPQGTAMLPPPKKSNTPVIAGAIAALVLVAGGGAYFAKGNAGDANAAPPIRTAAPLPVPAPVPDPVVADPRVTIVTTPPGASVTLTQGGEQRSGTTPATFSLKAGVPVEARVSVAGFADLEEKFSPTQDAELRWTLAPVPTPAPQPTPAAAPPAPKANPTGKKGEKTADGKVGDGLVDVDL